MPVNVKNAALFVDFDNIYSSLRLSHGKAIADLFANSPIHWTMWLESLNLKRIYPDPIYRHILKKVCFINSGAYPKLGANFAKAGFRVVDCPQVTAQGKTSADMHIVIDIMDTLSHATHYDEFFILSGDCDFAPISMRLREHNRVVVILPVGNVATAYTSTASWRIREDWLVKELVRAGESREVPTVIDDKVGSTNIRPHREEQSAEVYTYDEESSCTVEEDDESDVLDSVEIEEVPIEVQEPEVIPETKVIENHVYERLPIRVLPENTAILFEPDVIKVGMYADFSRLFPWFTGELAEHVEFRGVIVQVSTYDNSIQERYEIAPAQNIVGALKPDKSVGNWNLIESYLQSPVSKDSYTLEGTKTELFKELTQTEDLYLAIEVSSAVGVDFEKAKQVFCKGTAKLVVRDKHSLNGAPAKYRRLAHGQFSYRCKILGYRIAFFGRDVCTPTEGVVDLDIASMYGLRTPTCTEKQAQVIGMPIPDAREPDKTVDPEELKIGTMYRFDSDGVIIEAPGFLVNSLPNVGSHQYNKLHTKYLCPEASEWEIDPWHSDYVILAPGYTYDTMPERGTEENLELLKEFVRMCGFGDDFEHIRNFGWGAVRCAKVVEVKSEESQENHSESSTIEVQSSVQVEPEQEETSGTEQKQLPQKTEGATVIPLDNFDEALPIEKSILVKLCEENPKISLASASLKAPITFRVVDDRGASRSVHAWTVKFLEKYHIKTLKALLEIDVDTFNKLKQEKLVYAKAIVFTFTKLGFEFPFDTGISPSERIGWNLK